MAISRDKKQALVAKMKAAFADSKGVAFARYTGLSVADIQELRRMAREQNVQLVVVKNRLVRVAMSESDTFKSTDTSGLEG